MSRSYKKKPFIHIVVGAEKRTKKIKQCYNRSFRRKLNQGYYDDVLTNNTRLSSYKRLDSTFEDDFYKEYYSYKENVRDIISRDYSNYARYGRQYNQVQKMYTIKDGQFIPEQFVETIHVLKDSELAFNDHIKNIENDYKKEMRK